MGTQLAAIERSRRSYETTGHDQLIRGLGNELQALAQECDRLVELGSEAVDETDKLRTKWAHHNAYEKMNDICSTLAALKAESLEAAAIQMRAVSHYASLDYDDVERQISTLIHSVVGALESNGGFSRDRWAGAFYLGARDAFEGVEA